MDVEKIEKELARRFSAPLKDYYRRRVIFWLDEEGEFASRVDSVRLENAKLLKVSKNNLFQVKKTLARDDLTSNFLVYQPFEFKSLEDDWLLNIRKYGEEFRADLTSVWLDEIGLNEEIWARKELKQFRAFFDSKRRRDQVARIVGGESNFNYKKLRLAVLSVLAESESSTPNGVLRALFKSGLDSATNAIYQRFVEFGAAPVFKQLANERFAYEEPEPDLLQFAVCVLLSASAQRTSAELFDGLERFLSQSNNCARRYDFVSEWSSDHAELDAFEEFARAVEEETRLKERFERFEIESLRDEPFFPCVDEIILQKLMRRVVDRSATSELIESTVAKRRATIWGERRSNFYEGLSDVAKILAFDQEHSAGFHETNATELWKKYENDYYRMDSYYRGFRLRFQRVLKDANVELVDMFKQVGDKVDALYSSFLDRLGENWANVASEDFKKRGFVGLDPQTSFYERFVKRSAKRLFVVISDALRYEVGAALAERLRRVKQSKVDLKSQCAIFPTITPFGMAALLPRSKLTVKTSPDGGGLTVLADGLPTDASSREVVLKKARVNGVALQYKTLVGLKSAEQNARVKGAEVVYIYHDKIDERAHASEDEVFSACEEAIEELCALVGLITKSFKGTRVLITSDHGFLYSYRPLTEDAKLSKSDWKDEAIEYGKRYAILPKGASPKSMLSVRFLGGETEFEGFSPRGNVRIQTNGGGTKFVHGGVSLQEMVVPVVDYQYLRSNSKEYLNDRERFDVKPTTIALLSTERKICNLTFKLDFYQKEAVGANRAQETYLLYFTDSNDKTISDVAKIVADKTSADARERTFRCKFNLKQTAFSAADVYYLVIVDEKGLQIPQREEFQIDVPFASDDFAEWD